MSEKKSLIERVRDAGQALIAVAAVAGFLGAFAMKALAWVQAGPTALTKAEKLEKDVRRLKRQNRFVIKAAEKTLGSRYDWGREEREVALEEIE